jgi:hypothetical protein
MTSNADSNSVLCGALAPPSRAAFLRLMVLTAFGSAAWRVRCKRWTRITTGNASGEAAPANK